MRTDGTGHLLEGACQGDDVARAVLLEKARPRLVLWIASRHPPSVEGTPAADEIAQDVLHGLDTDFASFAGGGGAAFHAWLFARAEAAVRDLGNGSEGRPRLVPMPTLTGPEGGPGRPALDRMHHALAALDEPHREVIRLRRLEELGWVQIGERLGVDAATARLRYCRALGALRETLGQEG